MELLRKYNITDKTAWRNFLLHNHPDKGGDQNVFVSVKRAYDEYGPIPAAPISKPISKEESIRQKLFGDDYKLFTKKEHELYQTAHATAHAPNLDQCGFITKKGTRCKNNCVREKNGKKGCSLHIPKSYKTNLF